MRTSRLLRDFQVRHAPLGLVLLAACATGCACTGEMQRFDVVATPELGPTARSVEVNVIGVSDRDFARWRDYPLSQYWRPDDPLRSGANPFVLLVTAGGPPVRLPRGDPIWTRWRDQGATHLFIVAFLPGVRRDRPGADDPRRLIFPLDRCLWDSHRLNFTVRSDRLVAVSQPRTEPKKTSPW